MSDAGLTRGGCPSGPPGEAARNPSPGATLLERNLAALSSLSSATATRVAALAPGDGISVAISASGQPVLVAHGRALDSRRDPVSAAQQVAAGVSVSRVGLLGLGSGYLAEALSDRGIAIGAIVERASVIAAACRLRDLSAIFSRVRVIAVEDLSDRGLLVGLRGCADVPLIHAASATLTPELAALADRWTRLPVSRAPRVLVVGPTSGGSLEIARHTARATGRLGADARLFDAAPFGEAHHAFAKLSVAPTAKTHLQGRFALLLGEAVVAAAVAWRPDLVIALAQAPLTEPALTDLRKLGARTAFWFVENVRVLPYWRDVVAHYDHVFAIQQDTVLEQMRAAGAPRATYLPMACDPTTHRPVSLDLAAREQFGSPVSFAGAPYLNRRHILQSVADLGLRVWGDGWEHTPLAPFTSARRRFSLDEMIEIFNATDVNLNVHSADHVTGLDPDPDYVNPRTFELAACRAFQLVDRRTPLADLFARDEVVTFESVAELRSLAAHYLNRPDERQSVAARAHARAVAAHTYEHRVATICAEMLPPELRPGRAQAESQPLNDAIASAADSAVLGRDEALLRMLADVRDTVTAR